jgi:hypothetical protein
MLEVAPGDGEDGEQFVGVVGEAVEPAAERLARSPTSERKKGFPSVSS